jgi:predicted amidohydrolase
MGYSGPMKVAAYQAPLLSAGSPEAIGLIREQVLRCESQGVSILCCPEAILGGLADYSENPSKFAVRADHGQLDEVLAPLASDIVTSIVGFTELGDDNQLYNSAAVFHRGRVSGVYRKLHPAIRRSVYSPGSAAPVFLLGEFRFGIVICYDSTFSEPAKAMASQGATALFVPTNNGVPNSMAHPELVREARASDVAMAVENRMWVIRADVVGSNGELVSHGGSGIVDPNGKVVREANARRADLLVADLSCH